MNNTTEREKSYYELLVDAMKQEYPIPDFQIGSAFANMEESGRKEFALMLETIAAQSAQIARLREVEKCAKAFLYWVDVYLETRNNTPPLLMIDAENEANRTRQGLKKALAARALEEVTG